MKIGMSWAGASIFGYSELYGRKNVVPINIENLRQLLVEKSIH